MTVPLGKYIIMFPWGRRYHSTVNQETKYVNLKSFRSRCQDMIRSARDFGGRNAYEGLRGQGREQEWEEKSLRSRCRSDTYDRRGEGSRIV